jgi:hypothetical protein
MLTSSLLLPPAAAYLKDLLVSSRQQPLHAKFRRGMEIPCPGRNGINVRFGCRSGNAVRRLYFKVALMDKEAPYFLDDFSPLMEGCFTPGQLPIFRHGSILEFFQNTKNSDYTDFKK